MGLSGPPQAPGFPCPGSRYNPPLSLGTTQPCRGPSIPSLPSLPTPATGTPDAISSSVVETVSGSRRHRSELKTQKVSQPFPQGSVLTLPALVRSRCRGCGGAELRHSSQGRGDLQLFTKRVHSPARSRHSANAPDLLFGNGKGRGRGEKPHELLCVGAGQLMGSG